MKLKNSASTTKINRSPSPKPKTPIKKDSSPFNKTARNLSNKSLNSKFQQLSHKKFKNNILNPSTQLLIKELQKNRQKLSPCLQIYQLLKRTNLPQRCLLHNNEISLYCLNQKRLLCVNCIYGNMKHRTHRVNAVKDSLQDVQKDNIKLYNQMNKQLEQLRSQEMTANSNIKELEQILVEQLLKLQHQFDEINKNLTHKYIEIKKTFIETFEDLITQNKVVSSEFAWLSDTSNIILSKFQDQSDENQQIRRHLLMINILQNSGLKIKPIRRDEIQNSSRQLFKEIEKIKQQLQKHIK